MKEIGKQWGQVRPSPVCESHHAPGATACSVRFAAIIGDSLVGAQ